MEELLAAAAAALLAAASRVLGCFPPAALGRLHPAAAMSQVPLAPQDGPPPEGYRIPKYGRNLPKSGLSSIALAIGGTGVFAFGMYKIIMGNRQRRCGAARRPQFLRFATASRTPPLHLVLPPPRPRRSATFRIRKCA